MNISILMGAMWFFFLPGRVYLFQTVKAHITPVAVIFVALISSVLLAKMAISKECQVVYIYYLI